MCGATGEVRLDGRTPDIAAVSAMAEAMAPRGPDGAGVWSQGPVALGHRRLTIIDLSERRGAADGRLRAGAGRRCSTAASTTTRSCGAELTGHGYRFFSTSDTEVLLKAYHRWGDRVRRPLLRHVRLRHRRARTPVGCCSAATGSASSRSTSPRTRDRLRFARRCPRCWPAATSTPRIDPVALHHYMTFHSVVPRAAHDPARACSKLPPATVRAIEPDGRRDHHDVLGARLQPARGPGGLDRTTTGEDAVLEPPARRGRAPDGRRRPGRGAALGRPRLQPDRRPARRGRPDTG